MEKFEITPLSFEFLLNIGEYDTKKYRVIKNECKVAITSKYFIKKTSSNEKIKYTLVSLIMHYGDSLDCVHYVSDVFNDNTGIWWHCDDANIIEISALPQEAYNREIHKQTTKKETYVSI